MPLFLSPLLSHHLCLYSLVTRTLQLDITLSTFCLFLHPSSFFNVLSCCVKSFKVFQCGALIYIHLFCIWPLGIYSSAFHLSISTPNFASLSSLLTIFIASGYRGSMRTPLLVATLSTSSLSAARLISFPFRSATQSRKSNSTQHCCSFLQNRSCNSATGAS